MEKMSFTHPNENRESEVILSKGRLLGHGGQGIVHEVLIDIGGHKKKMALKEFNPVTGENAHTRAEIAFKNYQDAQRAGLKVFNTFRLNKDKSSILMTNGHNEETICLGINDIKKGIDEELGGEHLKSIDNFDEFLNNFYAELLKATKNNFDIAGDTIFFFVDKKTKSHLDFVFGDLDISGKRKSEVNLDYMIMENMETINYFLDKYVDINTKEIYKQKVKDFLKSKGIEL